MRLLFAIRSVRQAYSIVPFTLTAKAMGFTERFVVPEWGMEGPCGWKTGLTIVHSQINEYFFKYMKNNRENYKYIDNIFTPCYSIANKDRYDKLNSFSKEHPA